MPQWMRQEAKESAPVGSPSRSRDGDVGIGIAPAESIHCLVRLSGPLFVTEPKRPLEVMSVVPASDVPVTLP